jgi:hypothetical protein
MMRIRALLDQGKEARAMGHSFVMGNQVLSVEELAVLAAGGAGEGETWGALKSAGRDAGAPEAAVAPEFEPVGIGKPMSIEILAVYTGDAPAKFGIWKPDLLVTSAVKALGTYEAAPRALNQLVASIEDRQFLQPSALTQGCPIVYYTPALVDDTVFCSFELVAETFDQKAVQQISTLFTSAAGLPIFAPASAYLLAGSVFVGMAADLGKKLLQNKPFLKADLPLRFDTPVIPYAQASIVILYNDKDTVEFSPYVARLIGDGPKARVALVHKDSGAEYRGDAPYILASLDGRLRTHLEGFSPKQASAAILDRFYSADTTGQMVGTLGSALDLYNDYAFRQKAEALRKQIADLDPNDPAAQQSKPGLEKLLDAYTKNIRNELFKKP